MHEDLDRKRMTKDEAYEALKQVAEQQIRQEPPIGKIQHLNKEGIKMNDSPARGSGGVFDGVFGTNMVNKILNKAKKALKHRGPMAIQIGVMLPDHQIAVANQVKIQLVPEEAGSSRQMMLITLDPGFIVEVNQRAAQIAQQRMNTAPPSKIIKP